MAVQDVLDALDVSKGAFYHYFDSKQSLLEAVVERVVDEAIAAIAPVMADPRLSATKKLERVFGGLAQWKAARKELMLAMVEVWTSDGNAIVREKVRRMTESRLVPLLSTVVRQGIDEGVFTAGSPDETAMVLVVLIEGFQSRYSDLLLARHAGTVSFEVVKQSAAAFTEGFARILGIPKASLTLTDDATLHFWFG